MNIFLPFSFVMAISVKSTRGERKMEKIKRREEDLGKDGRNEYKW